MSRQTELEQKYGKILFEDAIHEFLRDTTKIDADQAQAESTLADMFEYYGVERLSKGFAKLNMPSKMYLVGGMLMRFTDSLPEGAGIAEVSMENSDWQCFLVRKDAGYDEEVNALKAASEE